MCLKGFLAQKFIPRADFRICSTLYPNYIQLVVHVVTGQRSESLIKFVVQAVAGEELPHFRHLMPNLAFPQCNWFLKRFLAAKLALVLTVEFCAYTIELVLCAKL